MLKPQQIGEDPHTCDGAGPNISIAGEIGAICSNLMRLFVNRSDCYAEQLNSGGYVKIEKPLTSKVIQSHLAGKITVGVYQLSKKNDVKWLCFDFDPEKLPNAREALQKLLGAMFEEKLESDGVKRPRIWPKAVLLEASRYPDPSYHVWLFFSLPVPAKVGRWLGLRLLEIAGLNPRQVEVFPKQTALTEENPYGNLVKLPLGFHRVEHKWSCFLSTDTFEPLPPSCILNVQGISFSEADLTRIMNLEKRKHVQIAHALPKNSKPLKGREEEKVVKFLAKYWRKGYRNRLEMAFLGFCLKRGVAYESARRIIERVCDLTTDEEKSARLRLVDYHYQNRRKLGAKLAGVSWIREVVREAYSK